MLASPAGHAQIDGSGTVVAARPGQPEKLTLGSRFGMNMKLGVPYRMQNTVVEYEENRLIAWQHFGKHRWRYELEAIDPTTTVVTETFDATTALFPPALKLINAYDNNQKAILATLVRLKALAEDDSGS